MKALERISARHDMRTPKVPVQQMNTLLDLLADVNRIWAHPAMLADHLQRMQYERQQQFVAQLTSLLGSLT